MPKLDLTGKRFGRLTAVEDSGKRTKHGLVIWRCECDCGAHTLATVGNLRSGNTRSCGCYNNDLLRERRTTHGLRQSRTYRTWARIKTRCTNRQYAEFHLYGGRGITVCDRWLDSFESFFADMGPPPTSKHSIDRIDNDKGYSPDNCRWATPKEQNRNRRNNVYATINGETKLIIDWAKDFGIKYKTVMSRISKSGLTPEQALLKGSPR